MDLVELILRGYSCETHKERNSWGRRIYWFTLHYKGKVIHTHDDEMMIWEFAKSHCQSE